MTKKSKKTAKKIAPKKKQYNERGRQSNMAGSSRPIRQKLN